MSTLILPPARCSMPAFMRLKYSCVTSLTVGNDNFIVNCWALAGAAARTLPATMPAVASVFRNVCIGLILPPFVLSFWHQIANADQRDVRDVGDERERDKIDDYERDDPAINRLEFQPQHRLGDEDVDPERRMKQAD